MSSRPAAGRGYSGRSYLNRRSSYVPYDILLKQIVKPDWYYSPARR
jgi:hypothetical protein